MRARPNPVEALITLPRLKDLGERRASWRQAVAALGQSVRVTGPPPLDGVEQILLVRAAQVALETGLVDDLDWIAPGSAAVALYEMTAALPQGSERRDFGRRVFARLYQGTAATFAAVASRMALGSGKALETPTMHARVALAFDMPIGCNVNADSLALVLVTRRDPFQRWIARPSLGALPARRLAAKLIEHAAREAVMRSLQGDPKPKDLLLGETIRPMFNLLLADREPLVWRHVAVARGLLAAADPDLRAEIDVALDPSLTPTEWRRAAVSLVACLAGDSEIAFKQCERLLAGEIAERDPGIVATMIWGLPRVIEAEPDAAEALLERLAKTRRPDVAEATASLLADLATPGFGTKQARLLRDSLSPRADDTAVSSGVATRARRNLEGGADDQGLEARVRRALNAFDSKGARAAYEAAVEAMTATHEVLERLVSQDPLDRATLDDVIAALSDIDAAALERSRLADLLLLGRRSGDSDTTLPEFERLYDRLGRWVLDAEERTIESEWSRGGSLANQRRLRVLLHLVDIETAQVEVDTAGLRARVRRTVQVLVRRLASDPDAMVHRLLCATLARSFDAAVREGVAEPSDLLLLVAGMIDDRHSIQAIAEASTSPEVTEAIASYGEFLGSSAPEAAAESHYDTGSHGFARVEDVEELAQRLVKLSHGIPGGSYRGEALRQVLLRSGRALEVISAARGLTDLVDSTGSGNDPVGDLEAATEAIRRLVRGSSKRLLEEGSITGEIAIVADVAPLSALLERAVSSGVPANAQQLKMAMGELTAEIPTPIASAIERVLERLGKLPVTATSDVFVIPLEKRRAALPEWLLPRRTVGAFYVIRALGSGGASSVFVARRIEERHDPKAEHYALKVPQYDPTIARSLSEQEFLQLFREEAGALLALPQHPNLARFVTFDLAAKPKPILVMELIRGVGLDRLIRSRALTIERVFTYLDGILAGLQAMHGVGVGHLDVKPSNVILRDLDTPVLVDFGLSGRHLRPGCGTIEYCAPEVLGVLPPGERAPAPTATDLYAFACTAFELLTANLLFDAEDETALLTAQVSHDGWPPGLAELSRIGALRELCIVLAACLRRDPRARPTASEVRAALGRLSPQLKSLGWPLAAPRPVARIGA